MADYGFVYIMVNEAMPDVFKLGCTERSPRARADELSDSTSVPVPFQVACYLEVRDFQHVERDLHSFLKAWRVSPNREFFEMSAIRNAVAALAHHPKKSSFCENDELLEIPNLFGRHEYSGSDLPNLWKTPEERESARIAREELFRVSEDSGAEPEAGINTADDIAPGPNESGNF